MWKGAYAETASFYIISVFDDEVDAFWPWQQLFCNIYYERAPFKRVKISSTSAPFITIRYKMNNKHKLLQVAVASKSATLEESGV